MYQYAGLPISLMLLAFGGVLAFGVNDSSVTGIDVNAIGVILMVIGALGIAITLMFWSTWFGSSGTTHRDVYSEPRTVVRDNPVIVERERPVYREVDREVAPGETERVVVRERRGTSYR